MRIAAVIEYDGSAYGGWQEQAHDANTVQARVQAALGRVANHPVQAVAAGRTDAGVHASAQVIHFDTDALRAPRAWVMGSNTHLPSSIALRWAGTVDGEFHARFSALRRHYRYVILNRPYRPALLARRVCFEYRPLDVERMAEAALNLLGEHDFSSYRAAACQAHSPVRTLQRLEVRRQDEMVLLDLEADGFLHHMVRNIAGVLLEIGAGRRSVAWSREVLEARDRRAAGVTAQAGGLYLAGIEYPPEFAIPRLSQHGPVW